MKKYLVLTLLTLSFAPALAAEDKKVDPSIGTWKLNVAKSKFNPGPPPTSMIVTIADDGKVTVAEVSATGESINYSFKPSPGTAVPIDGMENATLSETKIDDRHVDHTWKFGESTMTGKAAIAKNGKTMTYRTEGSNPKGKPVHNVELFEKQ